MVGKRCIRWGRERARCEGERGGGGAGERLSGGATAEGVRRALSRLARETAFCSVLRRLLTRDGHSSPGSP
eukprot:2003694-Pleurochrysis_carterae.AAC.1